MIEYILRVARLIEEEGPGARVEWRAWKSFLGYLRNLITTEIAFIEQIFPQKMDVRHGSIVRKIAKEVPAISVTIASNIIMELDRICRMGRSNSQLVAAESLGLAWMCLTASRLRLTISFLLKILKAFLPGL